MKKSNLWRGRRGDWTEEERGRIEGGERRGGKIRKETLTGSGIVSTCSLQVDLVPPVSV